MAIGEQHGLAVVARLEELLGAAVHESDPRIGAQDTSTVDDDRELEAGMQDRVPVGQMQRGIAGKLCGESDAEQPLCRHPVIVPEASPGADRGGLRSDP